MLEQAKTVDEHLGIPPQESRASKKARVREANKQDAPVQPKKEKRKDVSEDQPEAKRVKVPEPEPEAPMMPQPEMSAPAALSV
jgi:tRNA-dihydrouridine synthase 2